MWYRAEMIFDRDDSEVGLGFYSFSKVRHFFDVSVRVNCVWFFFVHKQEMKEICQYKTSF